MRSVKGSNAENAFPNCPLPTAFHVDLGGSTHSVALALDAPLGGNVEVGKVIVPARCKDNVGNDEVEGEVDDVGLGLALPDVVSEGSDSIKSSISSKSRKLELFEEGDEADEANASP